MRVVVTGGAGFIGSHVIRQLHERGHEITVLDRNHAAPVDLEIAQPVMFAGAEAVIHCAAHADIRYNWTGQNDLWRDNYIALRRTLECASEIESIKRFVFISTGAVYANNRYADTRNALVATSPYAASKLAGEAMVQAFAHKFGWNWSVVRPASCFGSGCHHGHIADFVKQYKNTGKIHCLTKGSKRDAVHVEDVAEHLVRLATLNGSSDIYNLSNTMEPWGCADTLKVMGVKASFTNEDIGWVGDPNGQRIYFTKLQCTRSVEQGVREALKSLGWENVE